MQSANDIKGFLNQLYPKNKLMNQLDFWHDDIDPGNIKDGF